MQVKINDLPTMSFHFFLPPNNILFCDLDYHTFITAEIDETIEREFCLNEESFGMMKKLVTDRKIHFQNNQIVIESKEGKYICSILEKNKPKLEKEETLLYENTYSVDTLKKAAEFTSTQKARPMLCGVILNELGEVYGTDSIRIFYSNLKHDEVAYNNWSIPVNFVKMLSGKEVILRFNRRYVTAIDEIGYTIHSVIFAGSVPNIKAVVGTPTETKCSFFKTDQINLFAGERIYLTNVSNTLNLKIKNDANEFNIYYPLLNECSDFDLTLNSEFFVKALNLFENERIELETNERFVRINNQMIIACMKR